MKTEEEDSRRRIYRNRSDWSYRRAWEGLITISRDINRDLSRDA